MTADEYLETLSAAERRDGGRVYTPPSLVRFSLDASGYTPDAEVELLPVLDPACGAGVFLEEALRRLAGRISSLSGDLRFAPTARTFLDAARRNLVGVDIDAEACALARRSLARTASELTGLTVSPDYFAENIIQADFLGDELVRSGGRLSILPPFGLVVGNPPYVATTRLDDAAKTQYRRVFRTASGRIDLYILFFERGVALLRFGGRLAFITPDKFLTTQSARPLRRLLREEGAVIRLARFDSHRVFRAAATVPCVTIFERSALQADIELLRCVGEERDASPVQVLERVCVSSSLIAGDNWAAISPKQSDLLTRISAAHPSLRHVSRRVSAGLATGRDRVFVLAADENYDVEPELLHAALRGRDITAFSATDPGLRALIPYRFDTGAPALVDIRDYPGARRYLSQFRADLEQRHCVRTWGKAWYDLHDPVPFDLTTQPKVVVPDVADRNRFAFDGGAFVPLHSAYYIVPKGVDGRYLTSVLNSKPVELLIRATAPRVKDGFSRYRSQFLLDLPVPVPDARTLREVVRMHDQGRYDEAVEVTSSLFGLSRRIMAQLESALEEHRGVR